MSRADVVALWYQQQSKKMSFRCQRDSYLRTLKSQVVSCDPAKLDEIDGYELVLEDTVLFPEGGGQINGEEVLRVTRKGSAAVHFVKSPFKVGSSVDVEVDWKRRFDHMQQHSGQHLITAISDKYYGFKTTSWYLAIGEENRCYVELATKSITKEQMEKIEDQCNECIRKSISMVPQWYKIDDPRLEAVRCRGLPDDFEGQEIRVVEIEGIDANTCCGTHVSNLSHLQCIKLLYTECKKGSTHLIFLVGNRVLAYVERAFINERSLTKLLSVGMEVHVESVDKLVKENKQVAKISRNQLRELAQLLTFQHLHTTPVAPVATIHRDDGDNEFMNIIANGLAEQGILVLVTVGGDRGAGQFLLAGDDDAVAALGPQVSAILGGKGGGRKGRYQGKASVLEKREEAYQSLRTFRK